MNIAATPTETTTSHGATSRVQARNADISQASANIAKHAAIIS